MRLGTWLKLISSHGFRIHLLRWPMVVIITFVAMFNSLLFRIQRWWFGRRIDETEITEPPIFIIGHWRSGTTHLHELMVRDTRFAFPTTYECFAPHHCLVTRGVITRFFGWLLPRKRPMDNMAAAWDRPQEDEFALCTLGSPTPYQRMAFPNDPAPYLEWIDMEGLPNDELARWRSDLHGFVQMLTYDKGRRLILKSPPHTGRIKTLSELFPGAKFIHIARDPYDVFASTRRLWISLDEAQGLQLPRHEHLDDYVCDVMNRMYRGFLRQREQIAPADLCQVTYEQLVRDPLGQLERIYEELGLQDFAEVRGEFEDYLATQKDYQTNVHEIDSELRGRIRERCAIYFEAFGYE